MQSGSIVGGKIPHYVNKINIISLQRTLRDGKELSLHGIGWSKSPWMAFIRIIQNIKFTPIHLLYQGTRYKIIQNVENSLRTPRIIIPNLWYFDKSLIQGLEWNSENYANIGRIQDFQFYKSPTWINTTYS